MFGTGKVELHHGVAPLAAEWDDLADRVSRSTFLRPGWTSAWWAAFGTGKLTILALRENGRLSGVLPMMSRSGALVSPTNWHTPEFGILADGEAARTCLLEAALDRAPRRLALGFLADDGHLDIARAIAATRRYRCWIRTMERSPYVQIAGSDWDAFERSLGKHFRTELRRRKRRLAENGDLSVSLHRGDADLDALLDEGFNIEGSGWKSAQGTAILSDPRVHRFYTDIARWGASRGTLRLAFLRVSGRPIAFVFLLVDDNRYYHLKGGFDPAQGRYAPGMLLSHALVEQAFSEGASSYEFLGDVEPFKLTWASSVRERMQFQAFSSSMPGLLTLATERFARPGWKRLRRLTRR